MTAIAIIATSCTAWLENAGAKGIGTRRGLRSYGRVKAQIGRAHV